MATDMTDVRALLALADAAAKEPEPKMSGAAWIAYDAAQDAFQEAATPAVVAALCARVIALGGLEWVDNGASRGPQCHFCWRFRDHGHELDCGMRAALLAEAPDARP